MTSEVNLKVRRLRPEPPAKESLGQCQAYTQKGKHWYRPGGYMETRSEICEPLGWDPERCLRPAVFSVNGRHLCSLHAGKAVLSELSR